MTRSGHFVGPIEAITARFPTVLALDGYIGDMTNPRLEDHAVGLELQLVELVEQRERARVQRDEDGVRRCQDEIDALQLELAETADRIATSSLRQYQVYDLL